ncbi:MAG: Fe(3+) transporter [Streptosporangiaceae bacterium]|nr:Fe(3+) transporter [Streptosporangiaceae bacterium]
MPGRAHSAPAVAPTDLAKGMGSPQGDGVFPRTVTHLLGRTQIPAMPRRIVALSSGQLDGLLSLGVVPIAGTTARTSELVPAYLAKAYPQHSGPLARMVNLGTRIEPNLEGVISARPDLILMNSTIAELYPRLSKIAPTVVAQGTGIYWKRDLLMTGAALGRCATASHVIESFQRDAEALGRRIGDRATVSIVRLAPGRNRMFGLSSFPGSIAVDIGLGRPASQRFPMTSRDLSDEQVNKVDATWVFYSTLGGKAKTNNSQSVLSGELWGRLRAVSSGKATRIEDEPWYLNPGPTAARIVLNDIATATRV